VIARLGAVVVLGLTISVSAANGPPPVGATAQCKDGSYSFSRHHSGTCSHHGGVAVWLDGGAAPSGPGMPVSSAATVSTPVVAGKTVLLAKQTKTNGCELTPNPDRRCSPGAYYEGLTKPVICSSTFRTGDYRNVPDSEKHAVEQEYGLAPKPYGSTLEIDHIVSLELGGSNDPANLFPEEAAPTPTGFRVKDKLENKMHDLVCAGQMTLSAARHQIAANWQALYKKVYGVVP